MSQTDIVGNPKYRSTKPPSPNPHIFPIGPIIPIGPIGPINPIHRDHHRGFFHSRRNRPIGQPTPSAHRPIGPAAQFRIWATHEPYIHGMSGLSPMEIPRHGLTKPLRAPPRVRATRPTSSFFLSAIGCCRFLTVTDNHQKARSRPLRLAPSPDAWGHYGFSRTTGFTTSLRAPPLP